MLDLRQLDPAELSLAERLQIAPEDQRGAFLDSLSEQEARGLAWDWGFWGRPEQHAPPGDWRLWYLSAGRGGGKTRTGAEWARQRGPKGRVGMLVAANPRDARDLMIEGPSGILTISPPWERPEYEPSKLLLTWPNGAYAHIRSADDPESIRGPSIDWAWVDELAKFRRGRATWDNLRFALREGLNPQTVVTSTPKMVPLVRELLGDPRRDTGPAIPGTVVNRFSTWRNAANVARPWLEELTTTYAGTRLGRQELEAELLEDVEGALWTWALIEDNRVDTAPPLDRVVVGLDPSGSSKGADCGIVVVGSVGKRRDMHFYVLADHSLQARVSEWATKVEMAVDLHEADRVVGETNFAWEVIEEVMRNQAPHLPIKEVQASRGKAVRAEPIVGLYEQGRVHHVGTLPKLEDELTTWVPPGTAANSPGRLDGLVWACTDLLTKAGRSSSGTVSYV